MTEDYPDLPILTLTSITDANMYKGFLYLGSREIFFFDRTRKSQSPTDICQLLVGVMFTLNDLRNRD
ncbi:hypothetical protein J4425_01360 [Candidatus Woesearchaeota archaeon]|nr:hypothetical protein [Candidatus Woesearchaeota archaeon]